MRKSLIFCTVILASALAVGQSDRQMTGNSGVIESLPVENPSADNPIPGPGMYAAPFVPLVSTPTVALPSPSLEVGASNATGANVAGAATSTTAVVQQFAAAPLIEPAPVNGVQVSSDLYPRTSGASVVQ